MHIYVDTLVNSIEKMERLLLHGRPAKRNGAHHQVRSFKEKQ